MKSMESRGPILAWSAGRQERVWSDADDRELLAAIQAGDEAAFDALIGRKTGPLLHVAQRIVGDREEARDVVQLAFLRVWEHRSRYQPRWSPNTWLYRITSNLAIDHLRARRTRERRADPVRHHYLRLTHKEQPAGLERLQEKEVEEVFRELGTCLTEKQRVVFVLRAIEGLSSKEVARIVGCRASTVRNHLFSARRKLRSALRSRYPEYVPEGRSTPREDPS